MDLPFWPNPIGYRNIDFGLERVYKLLERLDNPHLKLPPTIHIAGTNGKGSTLAFLRSILQESNLKIHSYTSPHLVNFNERIILANNEIDDKFLNEILSQCQKAAQMKPRINVTFFEGITVAAFLAFSRVKADILLLETGMGGRLDATNVLNKVLCSIITPISLDHSEFLGKTIAKIAQEKSGIIKENCPIFSAKQLKSAFNRIKNTANAKKSPFKAFNCDWSIKINKNNFIFKGFDKEICFLNPTLIGKHQIENASLAIAVILGQKQFKITEKQLKLGLKNAFWPARLQKIDNFNHKNHQIYLDGGHNISAATAINNFLKSQKNIKKYVIFAMLETKDSQKFLSKIASQTTKLIAIKAKHQNQFQDLKKIVKTAQKLKINATAAQNFEEAFKICNLEQENALILICGSLYFAGEFLKWQENSKRNT